MPPRSKLSLSKHDGTLMRFSTCMAARPAGKLPAETIVRNFNPVLKYRDAAFANTDIKECLFESLSMRCSSSKYSSV
jgi:hypothetical protein